MRVTPVQMPHQTPVHPGFVVSGIPKIRGLRSSAIAQAFGSISFERVQMRSDRCWLTIRWVPLPAAFEHGIVDPFAGARADTRQGRRPPMRREVVLPALKNGGRLFERVQTSARAVCPAFASKFSLTEFELDFGPSFERVQMEAPLTSISSLTLLAAQFDYSAIGLPGSILMKARSEPSTAPGTSLVRLRAGLFERVQMDPPSRFLSAAFKHTSSESRGAFFGSAQGGAKSSLSVEVRHSPAWPLVAMSFERVQTEIRLRPISTDSGRPHNESAAVPLTLFERVQTADGWRPLFTVLTVPVNQRPTLFFDCVQPECLSRSPPAASQCYSEASPFAPFEGALVDTRSHPLSAASRPSFNPVPTGSFERVQIGTGTQPQSAAPETAPDRLPTKSFERVQTNRPQPRPLATHSCPGGRAMPPPK